MPDLSLEQALYARGISRVAGIDEAGRGPLAGPVAAAAVILPKNFFCPGLDDSKKLSAAARRKLKVEHVALRVKDFADYLVEPALSLVLEE